MPAKSSNGFAPRLRPTSPGSSVANASRSKAKLTWREQLQSVEDGQARITLA
jgi:hypothetical protein